MPLLELKNVSSAYGSVQALRGVSLHVEQAPQPGNVDPSPSSTSIH